ncbi:hypothetical protein AVEN_207055-1 [Araneus ventricosus]|uniref:Uncharacterized protein n=1 Tax=Araneus ventricosus TaxID=182803 RepID=A0A4Y2PME1_ARAVE|nr:hypothetical protein AVEN_175502-1 [Araneus ventricosus]GBN53138.1 hypothetical protein AVEN_161794-1 [Araneus ventricosus]GBN85536.1 hypothetical protein AVEN_162426-1 [Araneus ventricosus]GBN85552.1 hypothetical protein AVEN_207055-1 [Araneus ventricosus]
MTSFRTVRLLNRKRELWFRNNLVATLHILEDRPNTSWLVNDVTRLYRTRVDECFFVFIGEYIKNRVIILNYFAFTEKGMEWPPNPPLNLLLVGYIEVYCFLEQYCSTG